MVDYKWEDFNNKKLVELKTEFELQDLVSSGKDEFEKQLFLKEWVHKTLPLGNPKKDYASESVFEILKDARLGLPMHCTQYAFSYLQCATSLGWYSRKLSVDSDHAFGEEEMHHGVVDIWSNQYKKWYVVDPMHNLHFEKNSIPLNSYEIRMEFLNNSATDIVGVIGHRKSIEKYTYASKGFNTPSNYFWFFIALRNNFFENPGLYNTKALLWVDKFNKDKIWYKGGGKKGDSYKHPMYENQFIASSDQSEFFPSML